MKTTLIHPSTFKLDGGAMFGIIPKPLWQRKIVPDENNRILMSLRVVLFETKNKKILVDTGVGSYHPEKFVENFAITQPQGALKNALAEYGIQLGQITDVILTHMHFDHIGGLIEADKIIFPNAQIHIHKKHWDYAQSPTDRDAGSFHQYHWAKALSDANINFIEKLDGVLIEDQGEHISFKTSFGHTPYMIHPYTDKYIYMADLVPMAHHVPVPWVMGYDIEPGVTTEYKKQFYQFIQDNKLTMIFEHDNENWGSCLVEEAGRFAPTSLALSEKTSFQVL